MPRRTDPHRIPHGDRWIGYAICALLSVGAFVASGSEAAWLLLGVPVFAVAAAVVYVIDRRAVRRYWHRRAAGLCLAFGYDLTGGGHERCPECGFGEIGYASRR